MKNLVNYLEDLDQISEHVDCISKDKSLKNQLKKKHKPIKEERIKKYDKAKHNRREQNKYINI